MRQRIGITLIELIIVMALLSILFSSMFLIYNIGMRIFVMGERRSGLRVDLDRGVSLMVKELQAARSITSASNRSVTFWTDSDQDQQIDSNELTSYSFSGITGEALVRSKESEERNLLGSISDFVLSYDSDVVDTIFLVNLSLSMSGRDESLTLATSVKLRNKPKTAEPGAFLIEE